jgi:hypothetical protein
MFGFSFASCQSPQFHIEPLFDEVKPFRQGIAAVRQGNAWGFVDTSGAWVMTPEYVQAEWDADAPYRVTDASGQVLEIQRSPETNAWSALPYVPKSETIETPSGTRIIFSDGGHVGLSDAQGRTVAQPVYDALHYLGSGLFIGRSGYKGECLLNAEGKVLSDCYQEITPELQYGRIRFRDNYKYGLMAPDGRIILPACIWRLDIAGHHIACTHGGKLELCNDRLEKLFDLKFDEVIYLDKEHWLAKTTDTGEGTIFDLSGKVVKPGIHLSDGKMMHGRFPAQNIETRQWGYIDSKGETVIPFTFYYTESFWPNGKAVFWGTGPTGGIRRGLIDTAGRVVQAACFEAITWHPDGVYTTVQDGKYQLLDENLNPLCDKTGKYLEYTGQGVYVVYDRKKSLTFKTGNWYTGEKGGFYWNREANVSAIYALDGSLLVSGGQVAENDPVPVVSEGFAAAKKNGKWGFVKCKNQ